MREKGSVYGRVRYRERKGGRKMMQRGGEVKEKRDKD